MISLRRALVGACLLGMAAVPAMGAPGQAAPPGQTSAKPPEPPGLQPLDLMPGNDQVASGTAFNPAITIVPNMLYYATAATATAWVSSGRRMGSAPVTGTTRATRTAASWSPASISVNSRSPFRAPSILSST